MIFLKYIAKISWAFLLSIGILACGDDSGVSQQDIDDGYDLPCPEEGPCAKYDAESNTLKDLRDNQVYHTTKIGHQIWMAENLNYKVRSKSWCYGDNSKNCDKYGRLYTWSVAMSSCPKGWQLPSDMDWTALIYNAGGDDLGGDVLKSKVGWEDDGGGLDSLGFGALPGGSLDTRGKYHMVGIYAFFYSSSIIDTDSTLVSVYSLSNGELSIRHSNESMDYGYSVRCMKDDI